MCFRKRSVWPFLFVGSIAVGQEVTTLPQQVVQAEKRCAEAIRAKDPENIPLSKQAMLTCRTEREDAEAEDRRNGGQQARWRFVAKYSEVDSTYKRP